MKKSFKRVVISTISILGLSTFVWVAFLLNPQMSYAYSTQFDQVTIYHNQELEVETEAVIKNAFEFIGESEIFDDKLNIELCFNDDELYPNLHPFAAGTMYAFFDKTVIYAGEASFKNDVVEFTWEMNNYETRQYDLTYLLAHEFMHNFQHNFDPRYQVSTTIGKINWKLEGHAEYISRGFKNDGQLKSKIEKFLFEEKQDHIGVSVFKIENGTIQNLSYYKYALVIQFMMEEKEMNYSEVCDDRQDLDELYIEMLEWAQSN